MHLLDLMCWKKVVNDYPIAFENILKEIMDDTQSSCVVVSLSNRLFFWIKESLDLKNFNEPPLLLILVQKWTKPASKSLKELYIYF